MLSVTCGNVPLSGLYFVCVWVTGINRSEQFCLKTVFRCGENWETFKCPCGACSRSGLYVRGLVLPTTSPRIITKRIWRSKPTACLYRPYPPRRKFSIDLSTRTALQDYSTMKSCSRTGITATERRVVLRARKRFSFISNVFDTFAPYKTHSSLLCVCMFPKGADKLVKSCFERSCVSASCGGLLVD